MDTRLHIKKNTILKLKKETKMDDPNLYDVGKVIIDADAKFTTITVKAIDYYHKQMVTMFLATWVLMIVMFIFILIRKERSKEK